MNPETHLSQETLLSWFAEAVDGSISPENLSSLEFALSESSETRKLWFLFHDMEIGMSEWAASQSTTPEISILESVQTTQATRVNLTTHTSRPHPSLPNNLRQSPWPIRFAAAAVILLSLTAWFFSRFPSPQPIATLTRSHNATWLHGAIATGSAIPSPRMIDLTSGMIEFEMSSGTRIVFEGPGRIELSSENSVRLPSGRIHATVPPKARGFTVIGDHFKIIDYGTEFGCLIPKNSPPELHVFKGSVEIAPDSGGSRILQSNQAVAVTPKSLEPIPSKPEKFFSPKNLSMLLEKPASGIEFARLQLKHHPNLKLYLDSSSLLDSAPAMARPSQIASDCHAVPGRTADLPALSFNGSSSHIEIPANISSQVFTMNAWIKVFEPRRRQDLLSQDGPMLRGEVAWYLNHNNAMGAGILVPPSRSVIDGIGWQHTHAKNSPLQKTTWHMLTTVLDTHSKSVTHYLDGEALQQQTIRMPHFLKLSSLVIGNAPDSRNPNHVNRAFHGLIDEFAILDTALSPEEIQRLYLLGTPTTSSHH